MGLDYSFKIVMNKNEKEDLYEYIRKHGSIDYGNCACIHFDMDSFILKYLEGGYGWNPHYNKLEISTHIKPDGKARIGCIYISITEIEGQNDEVEVFLTAATSDMSLLFRDSVSINRWFIELSKEMNSIITYIDMEDEGVKIIYFKGSQIDLEIKGKQHLGDLRKIFFDIFKEFYVRYKHFEE
ncbi:hypothetical protein [Paenibacillus brasilensis]|uniref:Uncharacterized protein n=1 Tax=Paenibacillus brasilensis TaxID=128574 RepID=A0ABU0L461_9BACL|nr:hypothetical protein [Paenibacillus brasilensis]MDQ0496068.1 hypothetical protein [Paenibacillus brasilensis]